MPLLIFSQNDTSIEGAIFDESGAPVFMADVVLDGGKNYVQTNDRGEFFFEHITSKPHTISISLLGMRLYRKL